MIANWDRQPDETEEWYDCFQVYLYMGPDRTIAAAHALATRLSNGATRRQLASWRRVARRHQWTARAAEFDALTLRAADGCMNGDRQREARGKLVGEGAGAQEQRVQMVAELLHQVYGVLRHADLLSLSKEEARQLLPTFRLFFRDLLHFLNTHEAAKRGVEAGEVGTSADDLAAYLKDHDALQSLIAEVKRVTDSSAIDASWLALRDLLVQLYPDNASARRIADQAHLDCARIHFSARAVDSWHAILTEAAHAGLMERVIQVVQHEYGSNTELSAAILHFRLARSSSEQQAQRGQGA